MFVRNETHSLRLVPASSQSTLNTPSSSSGSFVKVSESVPSRLRCTDDVEGVRVPLDVQQLKNDVLRVGTTSLCLSLADSMLGRLGIPQKVSASPRMNLDLRRIGDLAVALHDRDLDPHRHIAAGIASLAASTLIASSVARVSN